MGIMQPVDCSKYDPTPQFSPASFPSYRKLTSNVCVFWLCAIFEYISNLQCGVTFSGSIAVQSLGHVRLFVTPLTAACQAPLSFTISQSLLKLVSIKSVIPSKHLILLSPSLPAFNLSQHQGLFQWLLFTSDGQNIGASVSVLPMSIQGWFPLGLTGLISLLSQGLSRVFSSSTVQKLQFFSTQPSSSSS